VFQHINAVSKELGWNGPEWLAGAAKRSDIELNCAFFDVNPNDFKEWLAQHPEEQGPVERTYTESQVKAAFDEVLLAKGVSLQKGHMAIDVDQIHAIVSKHFNLTL